MSEEEEAKDDFKHTVAFNTQGTGYTIRLSSKSHLAAFLSTLKDVHKPDGLYYEHWCTYHDGWETQVRWDLSKPFPKCYEEELLKRGEIQKPNDRRF